MLYWAYGMNTNAVEMARRCPGARSLGSAVLLNHQLVFSHHCDVRPRWGGQVYGVLWQITRSNLAALDVLEGRPWYYDRDWVVVTTPDHSTHRALCYRMVDDLALSRPSASYLNCVSEGYRSHGIDQAQIAQALDYCRDQLALSLS